MKSRRTYAAVAEGKRQRPGDSNNVAQSTTKRLTVDRQNEDARAEEQDENSEQEDTVKCERCLLRHPTEQVYSPWHLIASQSLAVAQ